LPSAADQVRDEAVERVALTEAHRDAVVKGARALVRVRVGGTGYGLS